MGPEIKTRIWLGVKDCCGCEEAEAQTRQSKGCGQEIESMQGCRGIRRMPTHAVEWKRRPGFIG